jgi:serine/threonine protein kinase/Tol biopolymer transport system component
MIGKTLSHYQITNLIGKGGMGEVFRAKDLTLGRDVAIKVLPEEFAKDDDRVARFQREAKLLASLNHPNIAGIHGLEESGGTNFLVLELVEGQTLAERIKQGPIPVEESLKLALQIAEALEAAHEKGVIHRDLKPANIKVTPDDKVKVLDFGLAKAFAGEQTDMNLSNSPTLSNAATQQGVILGTAAYMSPEQARGKSVDRKADIWAFGCVLYEMLIGEAAFQGEDITEILSSVVKGGTNLDLLPANLHPRVREVITRCLQKDLKSRYSGITDARYEIGQALADPGGLLMQQATAFKPRKQLRLILPWIAAIATLCLVITGMTVWKFKPGEPKPVMRFYHDVPQDQRLIDYRITHPSIAISPDGKHLVYGAPKGLYLRSADEFDAKLLSGTETDPIDPFFSPDSKWIAYISTTDHKLKKIALSGGAPVTLCAVQDGMGASWGADGRIVFAERQKGIMRVSGNGGTPVQIIGTAQTEIFASPQVLPDGKSVLYFTSAGTSPFKVMVQSLKSGERKELFEGDSARYLPTGHIAYTLNNNLFAVPFDPGKLAITGDPVCMIESVYREGDYAPQYAVSDSGTLAYIPGTTENITYDRKTLVWVDRKGKEIPIPAALNSYELLRISPDGTKVALQIYSAGECDIWVYEMVRETMSRLTFNKASSFPVWTPDGKCIVFRFGSERKSAIYRKSADGTGTDDKLSADLLNLEPWSWSGEGKTLLFNRQDEVAEGKAFIEVLSMEGHGEVRTLLKGKYNEWMPRVSPDGRYLAYASDELGKPEIFVRPFPDVSKGKWQVSIGGGDGPLWSPNGRELFYRHGEAVMAVAVEAEPAFKPGKAEVLFQGKYVDWDISPDGKRFLMTKGATQTDNPGEALRKINIVLNWFEELKQRVPVK